MRHRVAHRKLGRVTEHRVSMLRNQAQELLRYERIETTVPRAKELRPFVERLITIAKRGTAGGDGADPARVLHARRLVLRDLQDREVVGKLFETIAPRFAARPGGYTRLLRLGFRRGDSAELAQVELVGSEYNPKAAKDKTEKAEPAKAKGVGSRLRAAAERLRGRKADSAEPGAEQVKSKPQTRTSVQGAKSAKRAPGKKGS